MDGSIEWEKFHPIEDENDFPINTVSHFLIIKTW